MLFKGSDCMVQHWQLAWRRRQHLLVQLLCPHILSEVCHTGKQQNQNAWFAILCVQPILGWRAGIAPNGLQEASRLHSYIFPLGKPGMNANHLVVRVVPADLAQRVSKVAIGVNRGR